MSDITKFYTKSFSVKRMTQDAGAKWGQELGVIGTFNGHLQQASSDLTETLKSQFNLAHKIWCAIGENIEVGDILTEGTDTYSVRAVDRKEIGANKHLEILAERKEVYAS